MGQSVTAARSRARIELEKGRLAAAPDPDEEAALTAAAEALAGCTNSRQAAYACISTWITTRAKLATNARLTETVATDLGDARLRGIIEAALPQIGGALSSLPTDIPLFELSKSQVVDAFTVAVQIVCEASVALKEAGDFPLNDACPF